MTRTMNARIAGFTFLAYIAAGLTSMAIFGRATGGEGVVTKLANIAQHGSDVSIVVLLGLIQSFAALILGVTLYGLTREQDNELAMMGMICRVVEGVMGGLAISGTLALQWLATTTGPSAPSLPAAQTLAAYLLRNDMALTATFFAVGSTLFAILFLRGRIIPKSLAWLGVAASVLLVIGLPLQLAGFLSGPITSYIWLPMLAFEVPLGVWLIVKGITISSLRQETIQN